MRRKRYQFGRVELVQRKRGPAVWRFRYYDAGGHRRSVELGCEPMTEADANKAAESYRIMANPDQPTARGLTFGGLIDQYVRDELTLLEWPTQKGYLAYIENWIRPKWGDYRIGDVKPFGVEQWLNAIKALQPKSKGHIRTVMQSLFNCAMRWEFYPVGKNPMELVRVPGISKRKRKPRIITAEQFWEMYAKIEHEQTKMISVLAMCLGLSISEATGLKWEDLDLAKGTLSVRRKAVQSHVGKTKTESRYADLPIDPAICEMLATYKLARLHEPEMWVFPAPRDINRPVTGWNLQQLYLRPAAKSAQLGDGIGFHTLRHSYSSMLRDLGVDIKVQQELMRHADSRTTLNIYTQSVGESLRTAQSMATRSVMAGRIQ